MGKHKYGGPVEHTKLKIRKLEQKVEKVRDKDWRCYLSNSEYSGAEGELTQEANVMLNNNSGPEVASLQEPTHESIVRATDTHIRPDVTADIIPEVVPELELDPSVLTILSDELVKENKFTAAIHKDIASNWSDILLNGLQDETRKDLFKSYDVPANLKLAIPPLLNPEIKAAVKENVYKRDCILQEKQKHLGCVIACLTELITHSSNSDGKNVNDNKKTLQLLSDAGRMLCDIHYSETSSRKQLLLPCLDKGVTNNIEYFKRDHLLFGTNLPGKLRSIKAVPKLGGELKSIFTKSKSQCKNNPPKSSAFLNFFKLERPSTAGASGRVSPGELDHSWAQAASGAAERFTAPEAAQQNYTPVDMDTRAGRLQYFYHAWQQVTDDPIILSWVSGLRLPFKTSIAQQQAPVFKHLSTKYTFEVNKEVTHLLDIGAIRECNECSGQFLSNIFLVKKSNGQNRFILNLKKLNEFISMPPFKIGDYRTAMRLISKNIYMCSIDIKQAYFSICIHEDYKKYLRFQWLGRTYEFQVLPFGLNIGSYVFTKLMRPVMQYLRNQGLFTAIYLDAICVFGSSYSKCKQNFELTKSLLESLGFIINLEKSNSIPSKTTTFLGFNFDSTDCTISIPSEKRLKIKNELLRFSSMTPCTLRDFAHLIGLLLSICPAVPYGWLYTKRFERTKLRSLKEYNNYDQHITLPLHLSEDFNWWLRNIDVCRNPIRNGDYKMEIYSDASKSGWGISCCGQTASGLWSNEERNENINYLELTAAFFGLKIFADKLSNCEILLRIDNTTAISYINRMGSIQFSHLNAVSRNIWQWCENRGLYVFASYISSADNVIADAESRRIHPDVEWELNNDTFNVICKEFRTPEIDLFASRINKKCDLFVSWHKDPFAYKVDAFTLGWSSFFFYAFPPFSVIDKVLQKIDNDRATGIVVVPLWPNEPWYPLFMDLKISESLVFSPHSSMLSSSFRVGKKPKQSVTLVAAVLSGHRFEDRDPSLEL